MNARQCLALQVYVIAVVRFLEDPTPAFERLLEQDTRQLEEAFECRVRAPIPRNETSMADVLFATEPAPPDFPDLL